MVIVTECFTALLWLVYRLNSRIITDIVQNPVKVHLKGLIQVQVGEKSFFVLFPPLRLTVPDLISVTCVLLTLLGYKLVPVSFLLLRFVLYSALFLPPALCIFCLGTLVLFAWF